MKRGTLLLLVLIAVLGTVLVLFMTRDDSSSIKKELRDFAVQDTASVDKIFMVKKSNEQVTLTREGNNWVVNGNYNVRTDAIDLLLKTIHRIQVKAPVSKSALDNVITMLATRNTKVEIYSKGKHLKTLYVGGSTQDQIGTFMMLEGSSVPFVCHIPGFIGYLSTRFFTDERDWRSPLIFDYNFDEIAKIKSVNSEFPEQSFLLTKDKNVINMQSLDGQEEPIVIDTLAVKFFLSNYERVASEFFANKLEPAFMDSLDAAVPFHILEVTDIKGVVSTVEAHRRAGVPSAELDEPVPEFDPDRMYAKVNGKDWVVIQYFVFDQLFHGYQFFLPTK